MYHQTHCCEPRLCVVERGVLLRAAALDGFKRRLDVSEPLHNSGEEELVGGEELALTRDDDGGLLMLRIRRFAGVAEVLHKSLACVLQDLVLIASRLPSLIGTVAPK